MNRTFRAQQLSLQADIQTKTLTISGFSGLTFTERSKTQTKQNLRVGRLCVVMSLITTLRDGTDPTLSVGACQISGVMRGI